MTNRDDQMRDASQAFMLVLDFIGTILLFAAAGYGLDWWQGTSPVFTLTGLGLGFGGGVYRFFRAAMRLGKATRPDPGGRAGGRGSSPSGDNPRKGP